MIHVLPLNADAMATSGCVPVDVQLMLYQPSARFTGSLKSTSRLASNGAAVVSVESRLDAGVKLVTIGGSSTSAPVPRGFGGVRREKSTLFWFVSEFVARTSDWPLLVIEGAARPPSKQSAAP